MITGYIEVYNRGPAKQTAWYAWVLETHLKNGDLYTKEGYGRLTNTPNAIAIQALTEMLGRFNKPSGIHIKTNSRYLEGMVGAGYVQRWSQNGWQSSTGKEVKNRELWEEAWEAMEPHEITIEHIDKSSYTDVLKREVKTREEKTKDAEWQEFLEREWKSLEKTMGDILGGAACA